MNRADIMHDELTGEEWKLNYDEVYVAPKDRRIERSGKVGFPSSGGGSIAVDFDKDTGRVYLLESDVLVYSFSLKDWKRFVDDSTWYFEEIISRK